MDIVFESLVSSPETLGTGATAIAALQSVGHEQPDTGTGEVLLESAGSGSLTTIVTGTGAADLPIGESFGAQLAGGWGVGVLELLQSFGFQGAGLLPSDGAGDAELPLFESEGTGVLHLVGGGDGTLPLLQAQGHEAAGNWGVAILPEAYSAGAEAPPNYTAFLSAQLPRFVAAIAATNDLHAVAGFVPGEAVQVQHVIPVTAGFVAADEGRSLTRSLIALQEATTLQAVAAVVRQIVSIEAIELAAEAVDTRRRIAAAIEAFTVLGIGESRARTLNAVIAAITLEALALRGWQFNEVASATFVADAQQTLRRIESLVEAVVLEADAAEHARFTFLLEEGVVFADAVTSSARFYELLTESVLVTARLTLLGEEYVAWAINAEGGAASRYSGFGFTSLAAYEIAGRTRYFGTLPDGIHELAGDTDAGAPIAAVVRGALSNYGSSALKGMPMIYAGLATTGELVMKLLITDPDSGQREAHWYKFEGRPAPALREDRLKPDRGLESVYWNWELVNVDGADFEIDALGFVPLYLSKRV